MQKIDIKSLSKAELTSEFEKLGEPAFRAKQVFTWLHKAGVTSFDEMTDISEGFRKVLKERYHIAHLVVLDTKRSFIDGTMKYLLKLEDGNSVETVYLPEERRMTLCLSTQVGCKYSCSFCASASFGFVRNLSVSEIADEVRTVRRLHPARRITNIVFMGIGEPFDNYENVLKAIRIFNDEDGIGLGARKMTISTCGIIPGIERLMREALQVELSVSLHAADDEKRSRLVPANKRYPLQKLMAACRAYTRATNRIITFEYVLLKGINDTRDDAQRLARLLADSPCKVNLISYNAVAVVRLCSPPALSKVEVPVTGHLPPQEASARDFFALLKRRGIAVTRRKSKGADIDAGCGQLRISKLQ